MLRERAWLRTPGWTSLRLAANIEALSGRCSRAIFTKTSIRIGRVSLDVIYSAPRYGSLWSSPVVISGMTIVMDCPVLKVTRRSFYPVRPSAYRLPWPGFSDTRKRNEEAWMVKMPPSPFLLFVSAVVGAVLSNVTAAPIISAHKLSAVSFVLLVVAGCRISWPSFSEPWRTSGYVGCLQLGGLIDGRAEYFLALQE